MGLDQTNARTHMIYPANPAVIILTKEGKLDAISQAAHHQNMKEWREGTREIQYMVIDFAEPVITGSNYFVVRYEEDLETHFITIMSKKEDITPIFEKYKPNVSRRWITNLTQKINETLADSGTLQHFNRDGRIMQSLKQLAAHNPMKEYWRTLNTSLSKNINQAENSTSNAEKSAKQK